MLVEINGKGGNVCEYAKQGLLRCPLIVRPTSEDQITGELFQVLQAINPRYWLAALLNQATGSFRFRQQVYRRLQIELWVNQPKFPAHLLPWSEGSTQVDAVITWENPPTTVFVEMKYNAELSVTTTNGRHQCEFPSDQLIRNVRVGLWQSGWYREPQLFESVRRDFAAIVVAPERGAKLVEQYQDRQRLIEAIPNRENLNGLPDGQLVGEISYGEIARILERNRQWSSCVERVLIDQAIRYLNHKLQQRKGR